MDTPLESVRDMEKLLVVDDNQEIRKQLKWGLSKDYKIFSAGAVDEALELFMLHRPRVVTLDLGLPPDADGATEGLRCLNEILTCAPETKVIVISGNEEKRNALKAVDLGAYDFYQKPIELDELRFILSRAFNLSLLEEENRKLAACVSTQADGFSGLYGQCPEMEAVYAMLRKVSTSDIPVLVLGESGTGKELVARAVHSRSPRHAAPFVAINCGAIPESLLESELFGHEKGAFTGASSLRRGKVEYAQGGTLFLDEIGQMPHLLQVKLLRFLQEKTIQRVGGREDISVDVRIVTATNVDIHSAIAEGRFREDLYYRIGGVSIELPPLRRRGEDLVYLANLFLTRFGQEINKRMRGFSPAALASIAAYEWPGNVRELENKVRRAVVMADSPIIEPKDLGFASLAQDDAQGGAPLMPGLDLNFDGVTLKVARSRLEKELVVRVLAQEQGNVAKAAEILGVSRPTLYDLMRKQGL